MTDIILYDLFMYFEIMCRNSRRIRTSVTGVNLYIYLLMMITLFGINLSLFRLMQIKKIMKIQDLLERDRY